MEWLDWALVPSISFIGGYAVGWWYGRGEEFVETEIEPKTGGEK